MDFDLSEDQILLRESVERSIADAYASFEKRRDYQAGPGGWSHALWASYAELGILGLPFSEDEGGIGGGPVETMLVMEAIGRGLVVEPYLPTVVLGGGLLRLGGSEAQRASIIPSIIDGSRTLALAYTERQSRYDLGDVATTAKADGDGFVLDGIKEVVLAGDSADTIIVSARTGGGRRDRDGITLFLVDADAHGLTRHGYATQDGLRSATITLDNVRVGKDAVLGAQGEGLALLERVADLGIAALAAEAVGAMAALHETTVDYLKQRKQFGTSIGSFQALQHRAADMLVNLEEARSMAMYAAMMAEDPDPVARRAGLAAAKVQINRSARSLGQEAVQLHGGIAMTWEYKAGHYFKRLTAIETMFGDTDHHLRALDEAGGLIEAA
jgi:pimeloyl-CoA dehydrogenase small subunit